MFYCIVVPIPAPFSTLDNNCCLPEELDRFSKIIDIGTFVEEFNWSSEVGGKGDLLLPMAGNHIHLVLIGVVTTG